MYIFYQNSTVGLRKFFYIVWLLIEIFVYQINVRVFFVMKTCECARVFHGTVRVLAINIGPSHTSKYVHVRIGLYVCMYCGRYDYSRSKWAEKPAKRNIFVGWRAAIMVHDTFICICSSVICCILDWMVFISDLFVINSVTVNQHSAIQLGRNRKTATAVLTSVTK